MNYDRLVALYHLSVAYSGGERSPLYRLGCIVSRLYTPSNNEEYVTILDEPGYEEARALFGKFAVALGGHEEGSGYHECACCSEVLICEHWEAGIERCDDCREAECTHDGCNVEHGDDGSDDDDCTSECPDHCEGHV